MKALSGFYYVYCEGETYQCRARGNFRKRGLTPLVGDHVVFQADNVKEGYVLDLLPRKNTLVRPPIANVDLALLVFSAVEPDFSANLADRFLVAIELEDVTPVICISKLDLADEARKAEIADYQAVYEEAGYQVLLTNTEIDKKTVLDVIAGKIAVIAGQSGVGKSTLLNTLNPDLDIETGVISFVLGRGKHTTRHVELMTIGSGFIADTPGFSSIEMDELTTENLQFCFPEIDRRRGECKFRGCIHENEPKCAVKTSVANGEIAAFRYEHYIQILTEVKNKKERY
ncbi:ribosome biogenesis GTPase [Listeria rocourtiae]|uniref:Small ribosomal subunit biogenesis GTPase RsgA n=2 Tax=Listeria rocourtiae TaxID=647910 RepID=A0A4R6ZRM6_9LIST|nr:GTPase RsgA [Listeria rocourtiae FSL F6-920]TDR55195.1 ribosome biogenesis GTPase [Listeria rocourtiae]